MRLKRTHVTAVLAATVGVVALAQATSALAAPIGGPRTANYLGYGFTVPDGWQIVDLSKQPDTCVRFDRHVLYLGQPGASMACPARGGTVVDSVLVSPATDAGAPVGLADNTVARTVTVAAKGVSVTAHYAGDATLVRSILAKAGLPTNPAPARTPTAPISRAVTAAAVGTGATSFQGLGFDTCAAPSSSTMTAWLASPYRAVGIYFGGAERGCAQPNLTANWVASQAAAGWHFIPLYFGPQVRYGGVTDPAGQGRAAADDAVTQAAALGFGPGTPLYYDMEGYDSGTSLALGFEAAWTQELHARGYRSGYYSSSASGIADLAANYTRYTMPDIVNVANDNGIVSTSDPALPANLWANHQRIHQYRLDVSETYGGVGFQIDRDDLDVVVSGGATGSRAANPSDVSGDGKGDLLGLKPDGSLWYYVSNGGSAPYGNGTQIGSGFGVFSQTLAADVSGDGAADLLAVKPDGTLWYYPNNSATNAGHAPFTSGTQIGAGFDTFGKLTAADINGDGRADLLGVKPDGSLWYYANNGGSAPYGNGTQIGSGFNIFVSVMAVDVSGDGAADLLALKPSGELWYYPNNSATNAGHAPFTTGVVVGAGFQNFDRLTAMDVNGDGAADLLGVKPDGSLWYYVNGRGSAPYGNGSQIGAGFGVFSQIF